MRRPADQVPELRYRRLLGCYPAGYRAAYAEEMLGVAMARSASTPGRRWPGLAEAVSLIVSGLGKRLGAAVPRDGRRDRGAWLDAAAALTVIGPVLLAVATARTIPCWVMATHSLLTSTFTSSHGQLARRSAGRW